MEKVLKRRDVNRQVLEQYVLDEVEQVDVLGPSRMPSFARNWSSPGMCATGSTFGAQ